MQTALSHFLERKTNLFSWLTRAFNSWAFAIKHASSPHKALQLLSQMHRHSIPFDTFSILYALKSCTPLHHIQLIRHLHSPIIKLGHSFHVYVATSLLNAYAVSSLEDAHQLFDEMPHRNTVTWNTMITAYSRHGDVNKARCVFEGMPSRDIASWSAMVAAYVNNGKQDQGLAVFREMVSNEGLKPDQLTLGSVLSGCAHLGSIGLLVGKSVHGFMVKNGWELNVEIGTVLVDMYAKCGFLKYACRVFELMPEKNVMTWTALICGSAQHGYSQEALSFFEMMQKMEIHPNEMTFTGVLNACAHTGLVKEGRNYFRMIEEHGLEPRIQHYGCMVDLFGKAGLLEEAYTVLKTMRLEPNIVIWGSFLSACKEHRNFEMAEKVIEQVLREVKPEFDGGVFSLISDLYVLNEKWDDAERVRKLMVNQHVRKSRGSSFVRSGL
ncbi:pentatricopeptide repeat-containing protein At5g66520-like [Carica papaya]|uniref:pentatricopeptide repeat-containing protein At5g66520-like n=1 Tax=Carica papaya TaxID=3649 RepID=UPI000B8C744D|nr:pentatricopeptide repeat-containing protein At5g66520-like [Carica papaya]